MRIGLANGRLRNWFVLVLALGGFGLAPGPSLIGATGKEQAGDSIRTCHDVLAASPELLAAHPEISVKAVVTFVEPKASMLFIHDGTAGIFVYTGLDLTTLSSGTEVTIRGYAQSGKYSPVIVGTSLKTGGPAALPVPEVVSAGRIISGAMDSQWVSYTGIVRHDGPEWLHRVLRVYDAEHYVDVRIQGGSRTGGTNLLDARVTVCGVCARLQDEQGKVTGYTIFVPGYNCVKIVEPPIGDPFTAPLVGVKSLGGWTVVGRQEHLVRAHGVVTFQLPGRWLTLRDGNAPLVIESGSTNVVASGQEVEVAGFVSSVAGHHLLANARWRETGEVLPLTPREMDNASQLDAADDGELVQVEGSLLNSVAPGRPLAGTAFRIGAHRALNVSVREAVPEGTWQTGAGYELTGVIMREHSATEPWTAPATLWLQNAGSARLISPATPGRGSWFRIGDGLWLILFAVACGAWWWQHRRQRLILDEMESTLAFNRARLARAESETARIARDLHDGVIQSIYAVGMRLEECRRLTDTAPKVASEKLATTSEVLNQVIRDVRSFLTGLEPASIQGKELKTALKSVLLSLGDEAADRIALDIDAGAAESLSSREATELFHLCKEAISNSLRHSGAGRVEVIIQQTRNGCRVEIGDNGRGFDPMKLSPDSRGLHNMQVRARNLGAELQLTTAPGEGTHLVVKVPKA